MATIGPGADDKALKLYDRAVEIDPGFTIALHTKANTEASAGRFDDAQQTLDKCLKRPSMACRMTAMSLKIQQGECHDVEQLAREIIASHPSSPVGYIGLAGALASQGKPLAAIAEALKQFRSRLKGAGGVLQQRANVFELRTTAEMSALGGNFDDAEKAAKHWLAAVKDAPDEAAHGRPAAMLAGIYEEMGRLPDAADVAEHFLAKRSAWEPSPAATPLAVVNDAVVTCRVLPAWLPVCTAVRAGFE